MHHVEPLWREEALDKIEVFADTVLAPWEVGYAGAQIENGDQNLQDMRLTLTTRPIPWRFQEANVPPEVLAASSGPVQCINTNGDGLCSVHSVFGVVCDTRRRHQTELYRNDAKAFIRTTFGEDFTAFSRILDNPTVLTEMENMIWFDLIRPACLFSLGSDSTPLTAEIRQLWNKVDSDVRLWQKCLGEVNEQQTAMEEQKHLRQAIVQAFSAICVESCEESVIKPLLAALDLLDDFQRESPYYASESDGRLYITYPGVPAPMNGPSTKYQALFDQRAIFQIS